MIEWTKEPSMRSVTTSVQPSKFFALTFILSWLIWIPLAMSHLGIGPLHIPEGVSNIVRLLGVLMPAASALILSVGTGGRDALRSLFVRLTLWRVHWKWWVAAVAIQPVMLGGAAGMFNLLAGGAAIVPQMPPSIGVLVVNTLILLIATLGEEIGWRGVALPGLQARYSALKSSVILGFLWAAWHLPYWSLLESFDQMGAGYLLMNFLFVLPLTFYITWFFNHARQSILLAVMFHLAFNIVNTVLLPVTIHVEAYGILIAIEWIVTLMLIPHLEPE
jgi:membrane protease YdiL (CAAX protease family)